MSRPLLPGCRSTQAPSLSGAPHSWTLAVSALHSRGRALRSSRFGVQPLNRTNRARVEGSVDAYLDGYAGLCGSRDGSAIDHSELQYRVPVSEIREPTEAAAQGALRGVTRRNMSGPGSRVCKLAQRLEANDPDRYTTLALTDAAENGSSSNRPPQVKSAHF